MHMQPETRIDTHVKIDTSIAGNVTKYVFNVCLALFVCKIQQVWALWGLYLTSTSIDHCTPGFSSHHRHPSLLQRQQPQPQRPPSSPPRRRSTIKNRVHQLRPCRRRSKRPAWNHHWRQSRRRPVWPAVWRRHWACRCCLPVTIHSFPRSDLPSNRQAHSFISR